MAGRWDHGKNVEVEVPFARESITQDLTTNIACDSCAEYYAQPKDLKWEGEVSYTLFLSYTNG